MWRSRSNGRGARTSTYNVDTVTTSTEKGDMIGVDVKGGRKEEVARECRRPCMKRKVHPAVHGCSSMWHFVVPFFVTFWVIRYITAGFVDPLTEVLTATSLVFTILFTIEMLVKWVGYGFAFTPNAYLKSGWNVLDFTIVMISLLLLAASVPVQRCEGDGGYGGSCAGKDFEYEGFEVTRRVASSA